MSVVVSCSKYPVQIKLGTDTFILSDIQRINNIKKNIYEKNV